MEIREVAVMRTAAALNGEMPSIANAVIYDRAYDTDTGTSWLCLDPGADPQVWTPLTVTADLSLNVAAGASVIARIASTTDLPSWITLYHGDDEDVPDNLRNDEADLIIHSDYPVFYTDAAYAYYDSTTHLWVNWSAGNGEVLTDGEWTAVKDFFHVSGVSATKLRLSGNY